MRTVYELEDFVLDIGAFELRRSGTIVPLEPRICELLAYLVQHRDRVVAKDELVQYVWKQSVISDSALFRCVSLARRALDKREWIKAVYGRGYRWVGPARAAGVDYSSPHRRFGDCGHPESSAREPEVTKPMLGRDDELATIESALDDVLRRRSRSVLISGEGGMGKSVLAREIIRRATRRGAVVACGDCCQNLEVVECSPWIQVWQQLWQTGMPPAMPKGFASAYNSPAETGAFQALQDFLSVERQLRRSTPHQPLTVVIENLHHADVLALSWFTFLCVRLYDFPLLVVATYRPGDARTALQHTVTTLRTMGAATLELRGLSVQNTQALLQWTSDVPIDREFAERARKLTEGNPLLVEQLALMVRTTRSSGSTPRGCAKTDRSVSDAVRGAAERLASARSEGA